MKTEQLKQAAMAATPGPWTALPICKVSGWVDVVTRENTGGYSLPFVACKHFSAEANAAHIAAANPATILALLECVDALRDMLEQFTKTPSTLKDSQARVKGHAALQKLEVL